ncbi:MAG: glycosyltransferase [Candidatus Sulfotelmatobacter sp.]
MSSLTDQRTESQLDISVTLPTTPDSRAAAISAPIFLMVNSLETGGTERQFVEVTRALQSRGVPVHLGCLLKKGAFASNLESIVEFDLGGSLYGLQSLRSRWQLARHLRKLGVKMAHAFDFYANLALIPAAKLAGIPVIGSHRQLGDLLTRAQFRTQLAAFRFCERVVCNSQAAAERLIEAGLPENKAVVIGNLLPSAAFAEAIPALPRSGDVFRIGMIARMNAEYKNHRGFLRAAKSVGDELPNAEFVLVGDGPLRAEFEREAAALGIMERVRFLGDRRDIPSVLRSLDISVVPSISESLSNIILESMAAGVPVVATAVGGNIEIGGQDRALLVPANDEDEDEEEELARAIIRLTAHAGLRSQMAARAQDFVRSHFGAERVCRRYEELYAEVLNRHEPVASELKAARDSKRKQCSTIRVALVAPSLRYVGGQAVQADLLIKHWRDDPEIAAFFVPIDPKFPFGLRWAERVRFLRTVLRQPLYLWNLREKLKNADIAHIFSASYTSFLLAPLPAWLVAKSLGKKTLINYRSGEARDHLQHSPIARHILSNTNRLVVPSGHLVDVLGEFGLQAQVVPNIIDLGQFQYRRRTPLRPHLICTRGFHPYYGIDVVVRAFAKVQKLYPEAQLDLIGAGALERSIRDLVIGLNVSNVNFLGVVSRQEVGRSYDRADIFVNGSNLDNMPVSVLEAFASGTPVATTEPEGMKYTVTHERTGLLSPPGNPSALAQNIVRLLTEPGLAEQLAQNGFEESKQYRWAAVRERWLRVYGNLIVGGSKSRNITGPAL